MSSSFLLRHALWLAFAGIEGCVAPTPPLGPAAAPSATAAAAPVPTATAATAPVPTVAPASTTDASVPPSRPASGKAGDGVSAGVLASADPQSVSYLQPTSEAGKIYCGTTDCDQASQLCCFSAKKRGGRCIPAGDTCEEDEQERHCDEAADCRAGELCCDHFTGPYTPEVLRCSRGDWRGLCTESWGAPVLGGERCMPGGSCKGKRSCAPLTFQPGSPGYCYAPPSVRCGEDMCTEPAALCGFDRDNPSQTECTDSVSESMGCASPEDCSGYPCLQFEATRFQCGELFDAGMNAIGALCKQLRDCPSLSHGSSQLHQRPIGCVPDRHLPAGVKKCTYTPLPKE